MAAISASESGNLGVRLDTLPPLPAVERLSPRVIRILGGNPSKFCLQGTNTYLVGTGRERLLVDTGQGMPVWIQDLEKVLNDENAVITKALLTHWHLDHVTGVRGLRKLSPVTKYYKNSPGEGQDDIQDGDVFRVEGATLTALHTPGHTPDHMCFVFEEERAIFTGDNVLGHGTSVFSDLGAYMNSLQKMLDQGTKGVAYPGHGAVIEDSEKRLNEYILHRRQREDQILEVLQDSSRLTVMEIVDRVYTSIGPELRPAAAKVTLQVLEKLEAGGRVGREEYEGQERWFLQEHPSFEMRILRSSPGFTNDGSKTTGPDT